MVKIVNDPVWLRCRPWIEAAVATCHGFETIEDVERMIESGHYQFWPAERSAVITSINQHSRRKVLTVVHGGGDLAELFDRIEPALCRYAKSIGCDGITGMGRRGWDRECQKRGYVFAHVTMLKDLK